MKAPEKQARSAVLRDRRQGMKRDSALIYSAIHFSMSVGSVCLNRSCQFGIDFSLTANSLSNRKHTGLLVNGLSLLVVYLSL